MGPAVGKVAARLGKPFMPWQQYVADVALEIDPATGRLAYGDVRLTVPRQSGKSTFLLAKAVHRACAGAFFGPRQQIVYAAQTRKDSRKKWEEDYLEAIKASRTFSSKVVPHLGNGNEHMRFPNRSRFGIESTMEKSGHGSTLDEGYVDEAFAQVDGRVEQAFRPAMITRTNTQLWVVSTAGWLGGSPYLEAKVKQGRELVAARVDRGIAYFEWSAAEDDDPLDVETWRRCMPALDMTRPDGSGITVDKIRGELEAFEGSPEGLNGFLRAYCNLWVPKGAPALSVIPAAAWDVLADRSADPAPHVGAVVLAVDSDPNRSRTTIAAAGARADGVPLVEMVENLPGVDWAHARVVEMVARNDVAAVVIDRRSAAASLIQPLTDAGVEVLSVDAARMAQACGQFYDAAVETGELRHLDQIELNEALKAAVKRPLGDAWAWDRRKPTSDITPLTASTLALWGWRVKSSEPSNAGRGRVIALT